jgi:uncharacterized protein
MIESPCNAICSTDPKNDLCTGCGRTREEIENWLIYSDKQKEKVLDNIKKRSKHL